MSVILPTKMNFIMEDIKVAPQHDEFQSASLDHRCPEDVTLERRVVRKLDVCSDAFACRVTTDFIDSACHSTYHGVAVYMRIVSSPP